MKKVLVIGTNEEMLKIIHRLIGKLDGFESKTITSLADMEVNLRENSTDILLLDSGFTEVEEDEIKQRALEINTQIKIVDHFGGGSGLLLAELEEAMKTNQNEL